MRDDLRQSHQVVTQMNVYSVPLANIGRMSGDPHDQVNRLSLNTESKSTGFSFQPEKYKYSITLKSNAVSLQFSDTVGWATGRASGLLKAGCWFVGGDDLTGVSHVLRLQLSPPLPSLLATIKSRMETFWYWLTQVQLKNGR